MSNEMSWSPGLKPKLASRMKMVAGLAASIPESPAVGEMYYSVDTGQTKIWNGTSWDILQSGEGGSEPVNQGLLDDALLGRLKEHVKRLRRLEPKDQVDELKALKEACVRPSGPKMSTTTHQGQIATQAWYFNRLTKAALLEDLDSFCQILGELYDPLDLDCNCINPLVLTRHGH